MIDPNREGRSHDSDWILGRKIRIWKVTHAGSDIFKRSLLMNDQSNHRLWNPTESFHWLTWEKSAGMHKRDPCMRFIPSRWQAGQIFAWISQPDDMHSSKWPFLWIPPEGKFRQYVKFHDCQICNSNFFSYWWPSRKKSRATEPSNERSRIAFLEFDFLPPGTSSHVTDRFRGRVQLEGVIYLNMATYGDPETLIPYPLSCLISLVMAYLRVCERISLWTSCLWMRSWHVPNCSIHGLWIRGTAHDTQQNDR
jgi:hypothetical protein